MLAGSIVFHGALIGVAALWTHQTIQAAPKLPPVQLIPLAPEIPQLTDLPISTPAIPESEPVPTPTALEQPVPADDTPPPSIDPPMFDPSPAPVPPPRKNVPSTTARPTATNVPSSRNLPPGPTGRANGNGSPVTAARPGTTGRWNVSSKPPYPMALKAANIHGDGLVQITTDASGRVVSATMAQSTGNSSLDSNTCRHAQAFWTGPANATTTVPITYQLH